MKKVTVILFTVVFLFAVFSVMSFATSISDGDINEIASADFANGILSDDTYELTDEDAEALYESLMTEPSFIVMVVILVAEIFLFVPVTIIMICFIVMNGKLKKKLKQYENMSFSGNYAPCSNYPYGNPNMQNNGNPNEFYGTSMTAVTSASSEQPLIDDETSFSQVDNSSEGGNENE